jgi:hypothetical protein
MEVVVVVVVVKGPDFPPDDWLVSFASGRAGHRIDLFLWPKELDLPVMGNR